MSELKARRAYFSEDEYDKGAHKICAKVSDCGYDRRNDWWSYAFEDYVYLKSEADKVIAELEDKALQYKVLDKEHCRDLNTQEQFFAKQIAHHKYKRCVDNAEICCEKKENCYNRALRKYSKDEADYLARKSEFWQDWEFRWLKIADKFKEAK